MTEQQTQVIPSGHTHLVTDESLFDAIPDAPQTLLALLYDRTPDAWRDTWHRKRAATPEQHIIAAACDCTRSATPGGHTLTTNELILDVFEHDGTFEAEQQLFETYLPEGDSARTGRPQSNGDGGTFAEAGPRVVVVDSLAWLLAHDDRAAVESFIRDVANRANTNGVLVYFVAGDLSTEEQAAFAPHFETVAGGADTQSSDISSESLRDELHEAIVVLRKDNPTNYGYLKRNWEDAKRGIEASSRNYPTARQIHADLPRPESTPRTLGPALKAFETLDVIGVWDETVAANRYDLTEYDERRARVLGELLEECDERDE